MLFDRSEVNLGVDATGFTVVKYHKPSPDKTNFVRVSVLPHSACD